MPPHGIVSGEIADSPLFGAADDEESDETSVLIEPLAAEGDVLGEHPAADRPDDAPADQMDSRRLFFVREATALAEKQPGRASQMWIEAAHVLEQLEPESDLIISHLQAGLDLQPDSPWLLPLVRRTLMRLDRFEQATTLGLHEAGLGGPLQHRIALLREAAAYARFGQARDVSRAHALNKQALSLDNALPELHLAIGVLQLEARSDSAAAASFERLAELLTAPDSRAGYLFVAATLYDLRLDRGKEAEAAYRRALEANPRFVPAALALLSLYQRTGQWQHLARELESLAEMIDARPLQARFLYQAGALHMDRTGDLEAAARNLSRAAEFSRQEVAPLQRLAYVHASTGRSEPLIDALNQLLRLTVDGPGRAALLTRIGLIYQKRNKQRDRAVAAYRQALGTDPTYLPATQALGTIYRQEKNVAGLLELCQPETEGTSPPPVRAHRHLQMAELLASELQDPEKAIEPYRRALELEPGLPQAAWGLSRILRQTRRFEELVELCRQQIAARTDNKTRNYLRLELSKLQAGPMGRPDLAIQALHDPSALDETRAARMLLIDLQQELGNAAELVSLYLAEARDTSDPVEAEGRLLHAAALLDSQLGEHERALSIYQQVISNRPSCVAALRAAGGIYHRLGRWNELIQLHTLELQSNPEEAHPAAILCRIGRIYDEHLGRTGEAIKAYTEALRITPTYGPALDALERLVRTERRWPEYLVVLEACADARTDPAMAADAYCRAAEIADTQLDDLARSAHYYHKALGRYPNCQNARFGLLSTSQRQGKWDMAAEHVKALMQKPTNEDEAGLFALILARISEYRLGLAPDLALYDSAARGALLHDQLRIEQTRARWLSDSDACAGWLVTVGRVAREPVLAAAYLLESYHRDEFGEGLSPRSIEAVQLAFDQRPEDPAALWALERALAKYRQWDKLGALWEKEAQQLADAIEREARLCRAANAYYLCHQPENAARLAEQAVSLKPTCLPALRLLADIAEGARDWRRLAELEDRLAEVCAHPANRLEHSLRASDLWVTRLQDSVKALTSLAVALTDDPTQAVAFERAELLLRQQEEYLDLSRLYRRRLQATSAAQDRIPLLRRHAAVLLVDLQDPARASAELAELLSLRPNDVQAMIDLSELLYDQRRWSEAVSVLGRIVEHSREARQRHRARLRQAEIWLRHLHETIPARKILEAARDEQGDDVPTQKLLVEIYVKEGRWSDAHALLDRLSQHSDPQVQVWSATQLAEVARVGLRDEGLRRGAEIKALIFASTYPAALNMLTNQYEERKEQGRFIELAEDVVQAHGLSATGINLRVALARVLLDGDQPRDDRAFSHIMEILDFVPDHEEAQLLLGHALEARGNGDGASGRYRKVLEANPICIEAYRGLNRVLGPQNHTAQAHAATAIIDLLDGTWRDRGQDTVSYADAAVPSGQLPLNNVALPEDARAVAEIVGTAVPYLGPLFLAHRTQPLNSDHPAAQACQRLGGALGLNGIALAVASDRGNSERAELHAGSTAAVGRPIQIQLDRDLIEKPGDPAFRFWAGRALALAGTAGALLSRLDNEELRQLIEALCNAKPLEGKVQQLRKRAHKNLPRKVRKQLDLVEAPEINERALDLMRQVELQRADQVGLLLSGSPRTVFASLSRNEKLSPATFARSPRLAALMRYSVSEDYGRAYRALWGPR
jgi:tetratricopeptide (TPR) repeat protein